MDAAGIAAELDRIINHPRGVIGRMSDLEREKGFEPIPHGASEPVPFSEYEWDDGVISLNERDREIRLVAIRAKALYHGAFKRMLKRITDAGYCPVIVEPIGEVMPSLVRKWEWDCTLVEHNNEVTEEWRPKPR
jgi:hypothetical protein